MSMRSTHKKTTHTWHKCNEERCNVCEGGLGWCTVCGGAEITLTTDCPGVKLTEEQEIAITNGELDFRVGKWWVPLGEEVCETTDSTMIVMAGSA